MTPLKIPQEAFAPMFSETLAVSAKRGTDVRSGTVNACIFDEGFADVISGDAADSRIRCMVFQVALDDWRAAFPSTAPDNSPVKGDRFTSPYTGITYAAHTVQLVATDVWTVEAREIGKCLPHMN